MTRFVDGGVGRRVDRRPTVVRSSGLLVAARLGAQLLAFVWFLVAARSLDRTDLGVLGVALTVVAVTSALAELGVSRSLTRLLSTGSGVRPTVRRAVAVRLAGAVVVGPAVVVVASLLGTPAPTGVVVLAVVVSAVSGVTDLHLTALRATSSVTTEVAVLVGERALFLVAATAWVRSGGGVTGVLATYLVTNALSAGVAIAVVRSRHLPERGPGQDLLDSEGRRTAVQSALSQLLPRVAPMAVAVAGTARVSGGLTLAQRPIEALALLGTTALTVVHPEARRLVVAGRAAAERRLVRRSGLVVSGGCLVVAVVLWPARGEVLRALSGGGAYGDVAGPLVACAVVAAVSLARQAAEVSTLSEARAGGAAIATGAGVAAGSVVAALLVAAHGVWGAVVAQGSAELVTLVVLLVGAARVAPVAPEPGPAPVEAASTSMVGAA